MYGAVLVVGVALGSVQLASMSLYGDLAVPRALPARLSPRLGIALGRRFATPGAPAIVRAAYAQALLHRGANADAAAVVATLPAGSAAADLRGQLAEAHADPLGALRAYVEAGDFERAQRLIDERVLAGGIADGVRDERALIESLPSVGQAGVRARALWRLGQITHTEAQLAPGSQRSLEEAALRLFDRALALAPNEETYLLAAGEEAWVLGDRERAAGYYRRALDAVPDSAVARAGLLRAHP